MNLHFIISASGGTVRDARTGLTWQRSAPDERYTWAEARRYAARLALDGGGWRLPTVQELISLVDYSRHEPAIDTEAFPNTPPGWFWSATPYAGGEGRAWGVYFSVGSANYGGDLYGGAVRCVR
jgi:hypothetical protein